MSELARSLPNFGNRLLGRVGVETAQQIPWDKEVQQLIGRHYQDRLDIIKYPQLKAVKRRQIETALLLGGRTGQEVTLEQIGDYFTARHEVARWANEIISSPEEIYFAHLNAGINPTEEKVRQETTKNMLLKGNLVSEDFETTTFSSDEREEIFREACVLDSSTGRTFAKLWFRVLGFNYNKRLEPIYKGIDDIKKWQLKELQRRREASKAATNLLLNIDSEAA